MLNVTCYPVFSTSPTSSFTDRYNSSGNEIGLKSSQLSHFQVLAKLINNFSLNRDPRDAYDGVIASLVL